MKAFLLAAGHGTRLRPLTDRIPKCLVPIRGVPLLSIWLEICHRYGVDEVLVNLHAQPEAVRHFLAQNPVQVDVRLFDEPVLLGSAGTVRANREWVGSESSFWIFYADLLTTVNLSRMADFHQRRDGVATLGVCPWWTHTDQASWCWTRQAPCGVLLKSRLIRPAIWLLAA